MNPVLIRGGLTLLGQLLDHAPQIADFVKEEWAALHSKLTSALPAVAPAPALPPVTAPVSALPAEIPIRILPPPGDKPAVTEPGPVTPAASQTDALVAEVQRKREEADRAAALAAAATPGPQVEPHLTLNAETAVRSQSMSPIVPAPAAAK